MNKKLVIILLLLLIVALTLCACTKQVSPDITPTPDPTPTPTPDPDPTPEPTPDPQPDPTPDPQPNKYTVTWQNFDGSVLEIDTDVVEGATPTYDGATPTRQATEQFTYQFAGWTPTLSVVTSDVIYTATFDEIVVENPEPNPNPDPEPDPTPDPQPNKYTVTWQNFDGSVLEIDTDVVEGATPTYDGTTPTRQATEQFTYQFAGWAPTLSVVTSDVIYTATFSQTTNSYTIIWENFDGTVLDTDTVAYGTLPVYDGEIPTKPASGDVTYLFEGWTPAVQNVVGNATYRASFSQIVSTNVMGATPVVSVDQKTVQYGLYPQTHVSDSELIAILDTLEPSNVNGWYFYENSYYAKVTAQVFANEDYCFDSGVAIVTGNTYWFECEPITWQILTNDNGKMTLLSTMLLDVHAFNDSISSKIVDGANVYANNYQHSSLRTWLNEQFYSVAFALNSSYVQTTLVDNGGATSDFASNSYACQSTQDKVFLPSYQDYLSVALGFEQSALTSVLRQCKTTDFARANGAWYSVDNALKYCSSYWTRTPTSNYYYCAWNVNSAGVLSSYAVDGNSHCVRPCITILL